MTKLEAFKEAARRDGMSAEEVDRIFVKINLANALPPDSHEELPRGREEAFIQSCLRSKRRVDVWSQTDPRFNAKMEGWLHKRQEKN